MTKYCKTGSDDLQTVFPKYCNGQSCGDERAFWDSVAQEPARLSGGRIALYSLRRAANRHPLYKEASVGGDWEFNGPWEMPGAIEFPRSDNVSPEATEVGMRTSSEARIWIARRELELVEAPNPKEGDVIQFWGEPPFGPKKSDTYWDVVKATADGEFWSTSEYTMMRIELRKKGKFNPVRKIENTK